MDHDLRTNCADRIGHVYIDRSLVKVEENVVEASKQGSQLIVSPEALHPRFLRDCVSAHPSAKGPAR